MTQLRTAPLPRTLLVALLAALAVSVPLATAALDRSTIAATVTTDDATIPAGTWSTPAPALGDVAVYALDGDPEPLYSFAWTGSRILPDRLGQDRAYDVLWTDGSFGRSGQDGAWGGLVTDQELADAVQGGVVGRVLEGTSNAGSPGCSIGPCEREEVSSRRDLRLADGPVAGRTPCGLFHRAQGRSIDLAEPTALLAPCTWANGTGEFTAAERRTAEGYDVVRFEAVDPNATVSALWLASDSPYPVAFVVDGHNLTLVRERRGDEPLASAANPPAPGAVASAPRTAAGPQEPDTHPFPLSVALAAARAHEDAAALRDWDAQHPDAQVVAANSHWSHGEETEEWGWAAVLSDGLGAYRLDIARRTEPVQTAVEGLPAGEPFHQTVDLFAGEAADPAEHAAPAQLPGELPTIEALWSAWRAVHPDEALTARSWSFTLRPDGWSVAGGLVEVFEAATGPSVFVAGQSVVGDRDTQPVGRRESLVQVSSSGQTRIDEDIQVVHPAGSPPPVAPVRDALPAAPEPAPLETATVRAAAWRWHAPPAAAVAGAGLLVLLVSALHHLWPSLRLFSRVQEGEALEHPLRAALHAKVAAEPGIHLEALARAVGRPRQSVEHHLRKLEALRLVHSRSQAGRRGYFVAGAVDRRLMDAAPALRAPSVQALLRVLARHGPGLRLSDAARACGLSPSTTHYHLGRLKAAGLAEPADPSWSAPWRLTGLGEQAVAAGLAGSA